MTKLFTDTDSHENGIYISYSNVKQTYINVTTTTSKSALKNNKKTVLTSESVFKTFTPHFQVKDNPIALVI